MKVKTFCIEILELLRVVKEDTWCKEFEYYIKQIESSRIEDVCKKIREIYGCMGSFNDLILYKNGQPCFNENERLDKLRRGLFEELEKCLH